MKPITVGICAYNEAKNLPLLLEHICGCEHVGRSSEVIVVCSGCTDSTPEIVRGFSRRDPRVRLVEEPNRLGKASALNKILEMASHEKLLLISADVIPSDGFFEKIMTGLDSPGVGISCGHPIPKNEQSGLVGDLVQLLWSFHNRQLLQLNHAGLLMHASEAFCIKRSIVDSVPPGVVNDDAYLAVKVRERGYRVRYTADAIVHIRGPTTITEYFLQRRRIIAGHYQVKKLTGRFSQYLFHNLLSRPRLTLQTIVQELRRNPIITGTAVLVEIAANLAAIADTMLGRDHSIWRIAQSTKTVVLNVEHNGSRRTLYQGRR